MKIVLIWNDVFLPSYPHNEWLTISNHLHSSSTTNSPGSSSLALSRLPVDPPWPLILVMHLCAKVLMRRASGDDYAESASSSRCTTAWLVHAHSTVHTHGRMWRCSCFKKFLLQAQTCSTRSIHFHGFFWQFFSQITLDQLSHNMFTRFQNAHDQSFKIVFSDVK